MTTLTDIPQSGTYIQQGAIFTLVAQLIDFNTLPGQPGYNSAFPNGQPINLSTASALSITIGYPDQITSLTVAASLYPDGSDGQIVYTTRNNGTTVDLSQVGLYHFQGNAVIGGVNLPPSYQDDFYVLANVSPSTGPVPLYNSSAVIMFDSNGSRWNAISVSPSGLNSPVLLPSGPAQFLQFNSLVMEDSNGIYWQSAISTVGVLSWTQTGQTAAGLSSFVLNDVNGRSWIITISTSGVLQAT